MFCLAEEDPFIPPIDCRSDWVLEYTIQPAQPYAADSTWRVFLQVHKRNDTKKLEQICFTEFTGGASKLETAARTVFDKFEMPELTSKDAITDVAPEDTSVTIVFATSQMRVAIRLNESRAKTLGVSEPFGMLVSSAKTVVAERFSDGKYSNWTVSSQKSDSTPNGQQ
jgi:hypothetical protein